MSAARGVATLNVGDALPERSHTPTNVTLFLYNAAVWNPHRIHYDEGYTTQVEKQLRPRRRFDGLGGRLVRYQARQVCSARPVCSACLVCSLIHSR